MFLIYSGKFPISIKDRRHYSLIFMFYVILLCSSISFIISLILLMHNIVNAV